MFNLGNLIINISDFIGNIWNWINELFTYQFQLGNLTISLWTIFLALGVGAFITVFIIRIFT